MSSASWLVRAIRAAGVGALALLLAGGIDEVAFGQGDTRIAQGGSIREFDHLRSGFQLTGAHSAQRCESCHISGVFMGTPRDCATCHTAGTRYARNNIVRNINHAPTTASCDTCHNTSTFFGARFDHTGVTAGTCATCHNGTTAPGKPPGHVPTTASCDTCHRTSAWTPAGFNHANVVAGTCATCHNGTTATGKTPNHIVTTAFCDTCHRTTAWLPTSFNHQGIAAGSCATCHNGTSATGKPASSHVPTTAACDACHTRTMTWLPVPATFGHTGVAAGSCTTCHGGTFTNIDVKSASHLATTSSCDVCHRTTTWTPASFNHQGVTAGTCATCHNGTQATGKAAQHIPTTASCDACHNTTTFSTATMNHTVVTATQCKVCHNGSYTSEGTTGALAKPANHVPEVQLLNGAALDCNACHTNTSSWTAETMNHNGSQGNGSGWCKACHQTGTTYLGNMKKMTLNHRNRTPAPTDCSQSGCHRPLGNTGSTYRAWD